MPIRIIDSPEPLTGASVQQPPMLIESDGLRMLKQELRRYCDQKVSGRSFLVAGHRGSGKTTLVQGSIQETNAEIVSDWSTRLLSGDLDGSDAISMRPLFILLQGPNLLPAETAEAQGGDDDEAAKPDGNRGADRLAAGLAAGIAAGLAAGAKPAAAADGGGGASPDSTTKSMETVLAQITLGLYRALAGEFTRNYAERAVENARYDERGGSAQAKKRSRRQMELASRFELELDQYPGIARLNEYWRLSRSLQEGVLFWKSRDPRLAPGQGYRELVALSSTCLAYQRICGKLSSKDENTSGEKSKIDAELSVNAKGSDFMKPITALLTGGAVGAGLLAWKAINAPLAVFAGLATALLSAYSFKYSKLRTQEQSVNRADLFIPDLSVATLDRILPVLLNRIRRAGLAPVFVVDELDKVDLTSRITEMVKRLKKLVAENAFFCFLTDRKYFEEMIGRTTDAPYPIEYTYFTNQLFIIFRHKDLHGYLDKVLEVPTTTPAPQVANAPKGADESAEDRSDRELLRYILLHDSQMHPIDLRRQLVAIRTANGEVNIPRGEVRFRRHYPFAIRIQVAIELILDEEDMRAEIDRRVEFLQLAHDALYYISRQWHSAPAHLDLSDDAGRKHFEDYLRDRKATNTSLGERGNSDGKEADLKEEKEQERLEKLHRKVDASTCDFLFSSVCKLAGYLSAPADLAEAVARAGRYSQIVVNALSNEPLLVGVPNKTRLFSWTRNAAGRRLTERGEVQTLTPKLVEESNWLDDAGMIGEFEKQLGDLTQHQIDLTALSSQFGIVRTSPAWPDVRRAIERLRAAQGSPLPYAEQEGDIHILKSFRENLVEGSAGVSVALICALAIANQSTAGDNIFWALYVIADALRLRTLTPENTVKALEDLAGQISPDASVRSPDISDRQSVTAWSAWVSGGAVALRFVPSGSILDDFAQEAWKYWEQRLRYQLSMPEDPRLGCIVAQIYGIGPGMLLSFNLESMSIERWTTAFSVSVTAKLNGPPTPTVSVGIPLWVAMAALQHLYFDDPALTMAARYLGSLDNSLNDDEFRQLGPVSDGRRAVGLLVCRERGTSMNWLPAQRFPLLVCSLQTARALANALGTSNKLYEALGITFVALDLSQDVISPVTQDAPAGAATSGAGAPAPKALFSTYEQDVYNAFSRNPKAPIPVMIDDLRRYPGLDPAYTATNINSPQELFDAVSRMLPGPLA
jgi:hypothetical protein